MSVSKWELTNSSDGQAGTMICITCRNKIGDSEDYQVRQRFSKYDWVYECQHRKCATNTLDWEKSTKEKERHANIAKRAKEIAEDLGRGRNEDVEDLFIDMIESGYTISKGKRK